MKAHVEAVTSFSILLSGFLVKIALFGLYKFYPIFSYSTKLLAISILFTGGITASASFFKQTDYKKLIAYTTVQEMSQLTIILFLIGPSNGYIIGNFIVLHSLISSLFFFISEIFYRIFSTRAIQSITGLLILSPKLSIFIVLGTILFKGLPFTAKNKIEMGMLDMLISVDYGLVSLWLIFIVLLGNIGFTYINFKTLVFNPPMINKQKELTYKEFLYLGLIIIFILFLLNIII